MPCGRLAPGEVMPEYSGSPGGGALPISAWRSSGAVPTRGSASSTACVGDGDASAWAWAAPMWQSATTDSAIARTADRLGGARRRRRAAEMSMLFSARCGVLCRAGSGSGPGTTIENARRRRADPARAGPARVRLVVGTELVGQAQVVLAPGVLELVQPRRRIAAQIRTRHGAGQVDDRRGQHQVLVEFVVAVQIDLVVGPR